MKDFPCTSCGCCCKRIDILKRSEEVNDPESVFYFSYKETNGVCENLTPDNRCGIYETRPLICNVTRLAETLELDKTTFFQQNALACNIFMDEDQIHESFRITITNPID